jgi:hypothetical protein
MALAQYSIIVLLCLYLRYFRYGVRGAWLAAWQAVLAHMVTERCRLHNSSYGV